MTREYQTEGVFVQETTDDEYQVETVYLNEGQGAVTPFSPTLYGVTPNPRSADTWQVSP